MVKGKEKSKARLGHGYSVRMGKDAVHGANRGPGDLAFGRVSTAIGQGSERIDNTLMQAS